MTTLTIHPRDDAQASRALRLRSTTRDAHQRLDDAMMALDPFANRVTYARLLDIHYRFHRDIAPLYRCAQLIEVVPGLSHRRRLEAIERDIGDLGLALPVVADPPLFERQAIDLPLALGWLYVAEGSTLGAAILLKAARGIGLNEHFGARHLAGHDDGRAQHWRDFTAALDRASVDPAEEDKVTDGAIQAFRHVQALAERPS